MPKITVTIDVPEFADGELRDAIVEKALDHVFEVQRQDFYDDEGDLHRQERRSVILTKLRTMVDEEARKAIVTATEERVPALVDEVMAGEFQPMTKWGERKGEPTTIRRMVGEHATAWLAENVNNYGKTDRYADKKTPRLHYLIQKEVAETFQRDLKDIASKAAAEVKAGLADKVSAEVSLTVRRLLGIG